ncbi:flagellar protein FlaG [Vibrio cincinnatiensis]|jgi:flagellar protein FlaG|uniref:Flagellar protein FlaG n=1 Tax=Vibrio cincinnatiensis DSM 19608 TaxID=1123491 RepID=A0A1T4MGH9_VIBCI|nr:flagellar protein FlaG [Vibrio cincinnatiensis]MCG3721575.1 flagellar protein FlaG [Vibrio cincinnatiensis]MCG3732440.1 flagellar protein FlaG [Vibrio cincinnatiensis]MCG3736547.1 flagellar protein FlaG [Vibrio cincinnatiensis]MCG3738519.1 flagellar protein FlaG [Vibrio cincinnatiensis]MCG3743418.1 flagellar protein FlaG [Vibrio cincinnatiensis]
MEVPSYTSNIQPYGSQSGIKFASENESVKSVSNSKDSHRSGPSEKVTEQVSEQLKRSQKQALEMTIKQTHERERLNEEQRIKILERMDEFVNSINKGLSFRVDEELGRDVVTIYEAATGDIIRQIPEEEMLEVLRRLSREQGPKSGLLVVKA